MQRGNHQGIVIILAGMLALFSATGCGSHTTRTTETVAVDGSVAGDTELPEHGLVEPGATTTTTSTTIESRESSPGIIGSAAQFVWAVVSFPFRVIGSLF